MAALVGAMAALVEATAAPKAMLPKVKVVMAVVSCLISPVWKAFADFRFQQAAVMETKVITAAP